MMRFVLLLTIPFLIASCASQAQQQNISVAEFEKAVKDSALVQVLDVRTPAEYQSGHLKHALLANWNDATEFEKRTAALDKSKPVYIYCLVGGRSAAAAAALAKKGYKTYNLTGGINAWKQQQKPIEQDILTKQITLAEYQQLIPPDKTVLVDFGAVWCPPCKVMNPRIDSLAAKHGSRFMLVKIDGGSQTDICRELGVSGFPTFVIYKNGKEVWRKEGIVEEGEFLSRF